ncbi:MAG: hypothetical protein HUU16_10320 [Candidatus Omnitrophica bacterium]|nr:hypothetical protein [bacterium]NUN96555.1 hypothetical protein [Candidatus Omnitrophota bacterium]
MPIRFPYLPLFGTSGETFLAPLLPLELCLATANPVSTHGLLDSGATVNVMPYSLGIRLGADWKTQSPSVRLTGNLAAHDARALIVEAHIAAMEPVPLIFAWSESDDVPLLLGQVNFFQQFDVSFHGARLQFELDHARP